MLRKAEKGETYDKTRILLNGKLVRYVTEACDDPGNSYVIYHKIDEKGDPTDELITSPGEVIFQPY